MSTNCPNCGSQVEERALECDICAEPLTPVVSRHQNPGPDVIRVSQKNATISAPLGRITQPLPVGQVGPDGRIKVEQVEAEESPELSSAASKVPPPAPPDPVFSDLIYKKSDVPGQPAILFDHEDHRRLINAHRVNRQDIHEMMTKCTLLTRSGYDLYGLFGRPATGKSCFVYALGKHFEAGSRGFGGFTCDGEGWRELANQLENNWKEGRQAGSEEDYYFVYQANNHHSKRHLAILDIAGEHFEKVESWSDEILDFFGAYLGRCRGFFILLDLDEQTIGWSTDLGARRKSRQLEHIVNFLSVAATIDAIATVKDLNARRQAFEKARQGVGKARLKVPVALCLSKADRVHTMNFGPEFGRIIPGDGTPMGNAWNVLENFWPEHFQSLLRLAPMLSIDWISCLGADFEKEKQFSGSLGLRKVFQHVVLEPPPAWTLSARKYRKLSKLLRL